MAVKKLERLILEGDKCRDMHSKNVTVVPLYITTLQWHGTKKEGKLDYFVTKHQHKWHKFCNPDGYAAGPFLGNGYFGVVYLKIVSRGEKVSL